MNKTIDKFLRNKLDVITHQLTKANKEKTLTLAEQHFFAAYIMVLSDLLNVNRK
jgi:hypothetical protein